MLSESTLHGEPIDELEQRCDDHQDSDEEERCPYDFLVIDERHEYQFLSLSDDVAVYIIEHGQTTIFVFMIFKENP